MTPQQLATRLRDPVLSQCRIIQREAADLIESIHQEQPADEKLMLAKHCEALSATIRRMERENAELTLAKDRLVQDIMELRVVLGDDWK
jgi:hypothetical protein